MDRTGDRLDMARGGERRVRAASRVPGLEPTLLKQGKLGGPLGREDDGLS